MHEKKLRKLQERFVHATAPINFSIKSENPETLESDKKQKLRHEIQM